MKEKKLFEIGSWLNMQGFNLDLSDPFWMDDCIFGEHKVRDIADMMEEYAEKIVEERMPIDEQIIAVAEVSFTEEIVNPNVMWKRVGFIRGAKWLRDKMKGESK